MRESFRNGILFQRLFLSFRPACSTPNLNANRSRDDEPANLQRRNRKRKSVDALCFQFLLLLGYRDETTRILLSDLDRWVKLEKVNFVILRKILSNRRRQKLSRVDFSFERGNRWKGNRKRRFRGSFFASKSFVFLERFSLIFVNLCGSKT